MAKKVNPKVFRLGTTRSWTSKWFAMGKPYIGKLKQDLGVKTYLIGSLREAGVDRVEIERHSNNKISIILYTAKPGLLIGRGGTGIDDLKKKLHTKFLKNFRLNEINLTINEVSRPNLSAMILAQSMILDIEKRMPFKRVMKQTIGKADRAGALGIKVTVSGRLNGSEIARTETLSSGKLPLQTLRADIDYAGSFAKTTYGTIGIKVWIYKGEIFDRSEEKGKVIN